MSSSNNHPGLHAWLRPSLRYLGVAAILSLSSGPALARSGSGGPSSLTAATYNVRVAVQPSAIDDWVNNRRHLVMQSIVAKQPDFMGFQEAYARTTGSAGLTQQEALGQLFAGTQWTYYTWEASNEFNMNPVIVNHDRFTVIDSGATTVDIEDFLGAAAWQDYHDLHAFFHGNGGFVHHLSSERFVNWVVADDTLGGDRVVFLTSHYETFIGNNHMGPRFETEFQYFSFLVNSSFGYLSRQIVAQAEVLKGTHGNMGVIIGGDFETPDPALPSQQAFVDLGYTETWRYLNGNGMRPTMGIDNLFAKLTEFNIDASYYDMASYTSGASDHKPLYADVTWTPCRAENYCNGMPNSAGSGATMSSGGSASLSSNDMVLLATGAVPNTMGLFYYGSGQASVPFGDGLRCVDATNVFRLTPPALANGTGAAARPLDFTALPMSSGPGMISQGETWYFQYWYRDSAAGFTGFNLSDGLAVTFCP